MYICIYVYIKCIYCKICSNCLNMFIHCIINCIQHKHYTCTSVRVCERVCASVRMCVSVYVCVCGYPHGWNARIRNAGERLTMAALYIATLIRRRIA